jgi:hypothetical protein
MGGYYMSKLVLTIILLSVVATGIYCILAVIKNKTVADPDSADNVVPIFFPKSWLKPSLMWIGIGWTLVGLVALCGILFNWF